jgi:hypothetical protein
MTMYAFLLAAALTQPQAENATILKAIDNICGDTWCEGDYSFRFNKVILDATKNSTQVLFTMSINYPIEIDSSAIITKQTFDVSCHVAGYSSFATIMENNDQLNWDFYTSLTDCIQKLEGRLSKVNRVE